MTELAKTYNPGEVEQRWYAHWERAGLFRARPNPEKTPYTVVIPPPNITGILTMGHVLNNTIQDVFVRWKRMQGYETLWMPGTDHAGIATQNVVEKSLAGEGTNRHALGREKFVARVWEWKKEYGGTIIRQLRRLGATCDWERERFTMDEGLSRAVQEMFVRLHEKSLIYRGKYIVNWCPKDHTAISDDEVNYHEVQGHIWHIAYPVTGSDERAIVATTRPETMLGDTAVAVHPSDERYRHLIGKTLTLPLAGRGIPVIADESVDVAFGTGMVKVTPAHDPNDFLICQRYNESAPVERRMEPLSIFDVSATTNDLVPEKYRGLDRFDARKAVVADLTAGGFLVKTEPHTHNVGRCYRCDTVIEPYLSDQWFVRMKPLAERALAVVQRGEIRFYPDRWVKTYEHWMTNIRDWCISRQLWWGHRIPVWYCVGDDHCTLECGKPIVSRTKPDACPHCGSGNLRQDEDVLDTWFSSWLWPFSTLGWPDDTPELRYFYPTDTLVTGPDIIFFWVARMIMAGLEVTGGIPRPDGSPRTGDGSIIPFRNVYFTGIIRDAQGRKMSKSLGNSPDPIEVIDEYGADALRFTIAYLAPLGQDVLYSNDRCELGRNFANKIWNAGRFLLMNARETAASPSGPEGLDAHSDLADRWIVSRFNSTAIALNDALGKFDVNTAARILYDFLWHDFCDWFIEMLKGRIYGDEPAAVKTAVMGRAMFMYEETLKLLHPFMPFLTEELWQNLRRRRPSESIMVDAYPAGDPARVDRGTERDMGFVQECINSIRNIRGELSVPPSREITLLVRFTDPAMSGVLVKYEGYFRRLARVSEIRKHGSGKKPPQSASAVVPGGEMFIPLGGLIDLDAERNRIEKELVRATAMFSNTEKKLRDTSFVDKAPPQIVEQERKKLDSFKSTMEKLKSSLGNIG
ncbi:MAG TPA: valine--tRNA ligase [Bacteroidota bacterium]|nr:valine--tRNA ligase [Bacteroidota bacterium]